MKILHSLSYQQWSLFTHYASKGWWPTSQSHVQFTHYFNSHFLVKPRLDSWFSLSICYKPVHPLITVKIFSYLPWHYPIKSPQASPISTLWTEIKHTKMFFDIQSMIPDRLWYNLVNIVLIKFVVQKYKRFPPHLNSVSTLPCETWHSRFASEQQLELWNEKRTKMFLSYLSQNEANSDKVWCMFSWFNLP